MDTRTEEPRIIDGRPEGMLEHELRTNFRDLKRLHGFDEARRRMAEIINEEAKGLRQ